MIVLDTNVVSNQIGRKRDLRVTEWLNGFGPEQLFLTTITPGELHYGASLVDDELRRNGLRRAIDTIEEAYRDRILTFSSGCCPIYGELAASRRKAGKPFETKDAMIAAICRLHGFTLATRNVRDFADASLVVENPFEPSSERS